MLVPQVLANNITMPFSENDNVDHPLSIYAASKKSNELMAHSQSLYSLPCTGLRFYGLWALGQTGYGASKIRKGHNAR